MFALSLCGVLMFSLRSALYHIKAVHDDDMRENLDIFDEKIDWDEFTKNQVGDKWITLTQIKRRYLQQPYLQQRNRTSPASTQMSVSMMKMTMTV